jgi:hypothetical protein
MVCMSPISYTTIGNSNQYASLSVRGVSAWRYIRLHKLMTMSSYPPSTLGVIIPTPPAVLLTDGQLCGQLRSYDGIGFGPSRKFGLSTCDRSPGLGHRHKIVRPSIFLRSSQRKQSAFLRTEKTSWSFGPLRGPACLLLSYHPAAGFVNSEGRCNQSAPNTRRGPLLHDQPQPAASASGRTAYNLTGSHI